MHDQGVRFGVMYADSVPTVSRRSLLKRGVALIGAAVGVHALGNLDTADLATALTVGGRDFHLLRAPTAGALPQRGDAATASGALVDEAGEVIGSFHGNRVAVDVPGAVGVEAPSALEWHSLNLPGGTIFGTGASSHSVDAGDTFAIIGGTGSFAGATGSYTAYLRHHELGGDGTAEFQINLMHGRR